MATNMPKISTPRPYIQNISKRYFWYENIPSGNSVDVCNENRKAEKMSI
jgi:hypothetical protein